MPFAQAVVAGSDRFVFRLDNVRCYVDADAIDDAHSTVSKNNEATLAALNGDEALQQRLLAVARRKSAGGEVEVNGSILIVSSDLEQDI